LESLTSLLTLEMKMEVEYRAIELSGGRDERHSQFTSAFLFYYL
jgi:hypothetical protein